MDNRSTVSIDDAVLAALAAVAAVSTILLLPQLPWLEHPEVAPLTVITAVALLFPVWRDWLRARLDLSEPFTLAVWTMAFWHFVVGATAYARGAQADVFYLSRLEGRSGAVVITQLLVLIGFISVGLGARSSLSVRAARRIAPKVPTGPTNVVDLQILTWTFLVVGTLFSLIGKSQGSLGYSAVSNGSLGAVTGFGAMIAPIAAIPIAEAHAAGASRRAVVLMAAGTAATMVLQTTINGNRGTVLTFAFVALIASSRLRRRYRTKRVMVTCGALVLLFALAVAYGSAYRDASRNADGTVSDDVSNTALDAVEVLWGRGPGVVGYTTDRVVERLDSLISTSVVVAQYQELAYAEQIENLDNDILRSAESALLPRALRPNKPTAPAPQDLAFLYFGFRNAYATTPISTLLRNFGPLAIPLGMALLGLVLGIAHKALAGPDSWTAARASVYVLCATRAVNYEASFASYLPDASRLVALALATIGCAWVISRIAGSRFSWGSSHPIGGYKTADFDQSGDSEDSQQRGPAISNARVTTGPKFSMLKALIVLMCVSRIAASVL